MERGAQAFVSTKTISTSSSGNIKPRAWLHLKNHSGYDHMIFISASGHDSSFLCFEMGKFLHMTKFPGLFQGKCLDTAL